MRRAPVLLAAAALLVAAAALLRLETAAPAGVLVRDAELAGAPATVYLDVSSPGPLVLVAHGYAGSRQMMRPISLALSRAGFTVAAFDFHGHGRHPLPMDADVTSIEGATAQLVAQTVAVGEAALALPGVDGPPSLLGHSMATDVVIRAAPALDAAAVVAVSMYSEAVTPEAPARLLIVSGASEGRLRDVARAAVRQVAPVDEGETARAPGVLRRAVAAPLVGHVGVLYSPATLAEATAWIAAATGRAPTAAQAPYVLPLAALLAGVVALAWPLSRLVPAVPATPPVPLPRRTVLLALLLPVPAAVAAAALVPEGALGLSAFGGLAAFLAAWGAVQGAVLWRAGRRLPPPGWGAAALYLAWALAFALALDRFGAAFVPTGPRLPVLALTLAGTLPFLAADALLTRGARPPLRLAARALPLAALLGAMLLQPRLGIAFTVIPVTVLYWLVYGTAARAFAGRAGAAMPVALALVLAWAVAASTPLVAA